MRNSCQLLSLDIRIQRECEGPSMAPLQRKNHCNGSTMMRLRTTLGVIGGPAKRVVSALSGAAFRQRHQ